MAKLRIFISSTHSDLKLLRNYVSDFIERMGFEATISENGNITYDPNESLDESCYRDAKAADIFLLIVGGRYGSATSKTDTSELDDGFYQRYESITRREFESAYQADVPSYILVDNNVMSEYETFKRNRGNNSIRYNYADSVNVFYFLDDLHNKRRNNPIFQFDQPQEIESWLKEQWSGLFKNLLQNKSQNQQLSSLNSQVDELSTINKSLQRYMEQVLKSVAFDSAQEIIDTEHQTISEAKLERKLLRLEQFGFLLEEYDLSVNYLKSMYSNSSSLDELVGKISTLSSVPSEDLTEHWKRNNTIVNEANAVRKALGLVTLHWLEN